MASSSSSNADKPTPFNPINWTPPNVSSQQWSETTPEPPASTRASSILSPESVYELSNAVGEQPPDPVCMDEQDRTVNGVLGVGLYVRSGSILRIGGPAAVLISITLMGLLAWLVMQCIGEMLSLWPISNALVEFVSSWVDEDLGTAVGIAYWWIEIWTKKGDDDHGKAIQGTIIFFVVPLFLVLFNSFGVQIYGLTEVIGGSLKLLGAVIIIICMIAINVKDYEGDMFPYHKEVAGNWAEAFFVCLSIAAFAYIGVEITAATALEARLDKKPRSGEEAASHATKGPWPAVSVQFSATWTSFIAWVIYFLGSLMMTLNVKWDDINLPRAGWLGSPGHVHRGTVDYSSHGGKHESLCCLTDPVWSDEEVTRSSLELAGILWTDEQLSSARPSDVYLMLLPLDTFPLSIAGQLARHNNSKRKEPHAEIRAVLLEVLSQLGSVSCLIVWTCECWAFLRFYHCLKRHQYELSSSPEFAHVCRFHRTSAEDRYPWRSHGQPLTMWLAIGGCLFVLIVADGASLWIAFQARAFLSAYLAPICFIPLWLLIKTYRSHGWKNIKWELEDLSNLAEVKNKIQRLDEIRQRATARDDIVQKPGWGNLWGLM
ncbi:conserved hypothetical protein [Aspergillus terreus NIH2624]|uniref:Amino acid permease/ SLC12A domain-containing protein n=1 Tax=Aspergillus terreus (strain NIH 2624 / FGSC A1156) TaxID=341663 RepID=Q0CG50_ASPTN|nr:uncharacterized protein ATEG_07342 [Aspergillus terreus NIH2624]EAU32726.1 conserved hypothetical protein [Aspergillus terreus NIH2624]